MKISANSVFVRFCYGFLLIFIVLSCRKESIPPDVDDLAKFTPCVSPGKSDQFEIITFNAEGFAKEGYTSILAMATLIKSINADVIAFQEISSTADFNRLVKLLPGWKGYLNPTNNDDWDLGYLIKSSETEMVQSSEKLLFTEDFTSFPRPPYLMKIRFKPTAKEIVLINIHLKCCSGASNENSRQAASQKLKTYIDINHPKDAVILLGDYNDDIISNSPSVNPFLNFINDPANYSFTDMKIAKGSPLWWSYPSYPSHIDHILISNELFASHDTTMVIKASPCYPDYEKVISDHRPIQANFRFSK
jgi:endonuclease/exonuclease/phosphatase family metal-dependent hydrolase